MCGRSLYLALTMSHIVLQAPVTVSHTTETLFTMNGTSILWGIEKVTFVQLDGQDLRVSTSQDVTFPGEKIIDISTFQDDVVLILTGILTNA
ncbi:hypothetical protein B0H11DRAFT_2217284 [Mycena galericulata]|nr:hypothetical protein B0H11DRAFT_2217284 [Mycena galericulata]